MVIRGSVGEFEKSCRARPVRSADGFRSYPLSGRLFWTHDFLLTTWTRPNERLGDRPDGLGEPAQTRRRPSARAIRLVRSLEELRKLVESDDAPECDPSARAPSQPPRINVLFTKAA
jgi:hypothetical protein